jgi:alpha-galactosidase
LSTIKLDTCVVILCLHFLREWKTKEDKGKQQSEILHHIWDVKTIGVLGVSWMYSYDNLFRLGAHSDKKMSDSQQKEATASQRQPLQKGRFLRGYLPTISVIVVLLASICVWTFSSRLSSVQAAPAIAALSNGVAKTPPLGWSSWNAFHTSINESVIKAAADAMVSSGMKAAGYQYINLDAGWWSGSRDSNGNITIDTTTQWPGGMQAVTSYIHNKGLKAGIYTDAGSNGCSGSNQGSYGHYAQDMLQFEQWGFDYVKVDWCGAYNQNLDAATQYGQIRDAIASATAQTGHPMVFSICQWGLNDPWNWGPTSGNFWRTSTDMQDNWPSMMKNFDSGIIHPDAQVPGAYNDLDMLTVGMSGLSETESESEFSLWAISGAPLIAGNDITTMSSTTQSDLTNSDVLAVDQDALGLQGVKVSEPASGLQVWSKVLSTSGQRAVALLNRTGSTANITVQWSDLGLVANSAQVRDLWAHSDLGSFAGSYTASVPSHGVVMLKVTGTEGAQTVIEAEASSNTLTGTAAVSSCSTCSGGSDIRFVGGNQGTLQFNTVPATVTSSDVIAIAYINGDSSARTTSMSVNGRAASTVSFPPTGGWTTVGTVNLIVNLNSGSNNTIKFFNTSSWGPDFDKINVWPSQTVATQTVTGTNYEAEASANTLTGPAAVGSCSTCSGGYYVRFVGGNQGTLQFNTVQASTTSAYAIAIAYVNGDSSARTASMSVNGGTAPTVSFPPTGSWTTVGTVTLIVNLNSGSNNTIKFFNASSWGPDFDKITVGVPQTPAGTKYEAEASANTLIGTATITSCATCSGGNAVYALGTANGSSGSLQFNKVSVSTAGTYRLVISYLNGDTTTTPLGLGSSRTASMSINGGSAITESFPATGDWSEIAINTLTVTLQAGNNTILFSNSSSPIPNIDKIDVA